MPRRVEKGPRYDPEARKRGIKAALGGVLVVIGIILTGISIFSLTCRLLGVSLQEVAAQIVAEYRQRAYPIIAWLPSRAGIHLHDFAKECVSLYMLIGGILRRPLAAIFVYASPFDEGAAVFSFSFGQLGSRLDEFFNWAQARYPNKTTWWRRVLFSIGAIVVMPLTLWVFLRYPHTMNSGGTLGTYQSAKNDPVDAATFDTVQFDTRFILAIQLALSLLVSACLLLTALWDGRSPSGRPSLSSSMHQPPNQAMQRTAGHSAFSLSMTSTFNQQRHALSPAVADLVSR